MVRLGFKRQHEIRLVHRSSPRRSHSHGTVQARRSSRFRPFRSFGESELDADVTYNIHEFNNGSAKGRMGAPVAPASFNAAPMKQNSEIFSCARPSRSTTSMIVTPASAIR